MAICSKPNGAPRTRILTIANPGDLPAVNDLIGCAIATWPVAERLRRLATRALAYSEIDFETFEFLLCRQVDKVVAVAVWGEHGLHYGPDGESSALLHGLYVDGHHQHAGTGTLLQTWLLARAATMGCEGIVVKAQRVSRGYFERSGYTRLPVGETGGTYPYRFWMRCTVTNTRGDECANVHRR